MSDYRGSLPVKTVRDDEFKIKIVDAASGDVATKLLNIAAVGDAVSAGVNDSGAVAMIAKDNTGDYALLSVDASGNMLIAGSVAISGSVTVTATDLDIRNLAFATDTVDVSGSAVTVSATNLDIRDLTHASDSVKIGDGTNFAAINASGELAIDMVAQSATGSAVPAQAVMVGGTDGTNLRALKTDSTGQLQVVVVSESAPTKVVYYSTSSALAASTATTHDYVVTNAATFKGKKVLAAGLEAIKVRVGTYNGTTFTPKFACFAQPGQALEIDICQLELLGDGTDAIRVEITNLGGDASDVYSTIQGTEE
jgi:hypothetical protein